VSFFVEHNTSPQVAHIATKNAVGKDYPSSTISEIGLVLVFQKQILIFVFRPRGQDGILVFYFFNRN